MPGRPAAHDAAMTDAPPRGLAGRVANYGDRDFALYLRRSFAKSMGYSQAMLERPVVGILDTGSGFNNCHRTVPELIEAVRRGVLAAGGLPLPFPTVSLCEPSLFPTSMHYRNLAAIDAEAMLTAQPMDAAVLVGGCDKTVPAQLMAAASADIPVVQLVTGPMLAAPFQGERLSACTDCRRYWAAYRAGRVSGERIAEIEGRLAATAGTCGVMGTASTMACLAETLGFMPAGTAAIPAVHADRLRAAEAAGMLAMRLIAAPVRPSALVTPHSVENALRVLLALGGSTNALIHLTAIAGRRGIRVDLARLNALSDETPVLVDLKPTGEGYMEDFHAAGGMPALLWELRDLLHQDTLDVTGHDPGRPPRRARLRRSPLHPRPCRAGLAGGRDRGPVRQPGAARRHPQAQRRDPRAVRDRGARGGVRRAGRPRRPHRRPGAGREPRRCAGAEECRAADAGGDAGGGIPADPPQARKRGGEGHAAHQRLPHVGHRVRHHRPARHTGGGGGRAAGAGRDRRSHPPLGARAAARPAGGRRRHSPAGAKAGGRRRNPRAAGTGSLPIR